MADQKFYTKRSSKGILVEIPIVEDPYIQKMIEDIYLNMEKYLEDHARKIEERRRFVREVFEDACRDIKIGMNNESQNLFDK